MLVGDDKMLQLVLFNLSLHVCMSNPRACGHIYVHKLFVCHVVVVHACLLCLQPLNCDVLN